MRRCVGCMESKPKSDLIRIAYYEGELTIDTKGGARGRGVYLCPDPRCLAKARKKNAIARGLRTAIGEDDINELLTELEVYAEKDR
jgi:predicted RNA-binding protein YlxR (DUF448 family)